MTHDRRRDPVSGRYLPAQEPNAALRAVLAARKREPFLSTTSTTTVSEIDTLLRQLVVSAGVKAKEVRQRIETDQAVPEPVELDSLTREVQDLNHLLRTALYGITAEEASE